MAIPELYKRMDKHIYQIISHSLNGMGTGGGIT